MAPENSSSAFLTSVYNMRRACSGLFSYYAWASLNKGACLRPHISNGPGHRYLLLPGGTLDRELSWYIDTMSR